MSDQHNEQVVARFFGLLDSGEREEAKRYLSVQDDDAMFLIVNEFIDRSFDEWEALSPEQRAQRMRERLEE